jgi:hypothetical protein
MFSACRSRLVSLAGSASLLALGLGLVGVGGVVLGGCTPSIGSACELSTDCSSQGDRVCDTAQPEGYCTVQNCKPNECPDEAACVDFNASVPGCMYSDRAPSRLAVSFCMAQCHSDGDCRDDYVCADPRLSPWDALILDDDQTQKVCIPTPDPGVVIGAGSETATFDAAVCQVVSPLLLDASADGSGIDGGDGGGDDAGDAGAAGDATLGDAGPADAGLD